MKREDFERELQWALPVLVVALALLLNRSSIPREEYELTNDVQNINRALDAAPRFRDTLVWWTGSLAHDGIRDYRPLTSYLFWTERQLFGKQYERYILAGYVIFGALCWLQFVFTSRLLNVSGVGDRLLVLGGSSLLVAPCFWNADPQPSIWLAWFPGHPVILCGLFMAAALVCFDVWLQRPRARWLVATLVAIAGAILTWGVAVVLPVMLAGLAWQRKELASSPARKAGALVAAFAIVGLVLILRNVFVPGARGPLVNTKMMLKEFMQVSGSYGLYLWGSKWPAYLALALLACCVVLPRVRMAFAVKLIVAALLCCIATTIGGESPLIMMATLLDPGRTNAVRTDLLHMLVWGWSGILMWRQRASLPTLLAFAMVALANLPTAQYTGWHYRVIPLFYWGIVYPLAWKCWRVWLSNQLSVISNQ